ncbi:MAG: 8-amino-7-oxononanoate synthase [Gammaproteobacteria bacterium]|nr:8-amino-7-oxononanoate synthase [Gammaproteobacteria bacterium]
MKQLEAELAARRADGLYRHRRTLESAQGVATVVDGHRVVSFCGNDYLGLAAHPALRSAATGAIEQYGVGSGASHLVNGHHRLHEECERRLAAFCGRDRALLFGSGYAANLSVASALLGRHDQLFEDRLNHASLIDGARLSRARVLRYRHNDPRHLADLLRRAGDARRRLVVTDGVFSMDGDVADLEQLAGLAARHDAWLQVDDAHGFGVLGERGAGLVEQAGMDQHQVPILVATLGKALGTAGAFVAGSEVLIETLVQHARPYVYSTASPPALAAATLAALELLESEAWRRQKLHDNITYLRKRAAALGIVLMPSTTAIQPLVIGDNEQAVRLADDLFACGYHVVAIRPPTVPAGSARLRITLSAAHESAQIDGLLETLARLLD